MPKFWFSGSYYIKNTNVISTITDILTSLQALFTEVLTFKSLKCGYGYCVKCIRYYKVLITYYFG